MSCDHKIYSKSKHIEFINMEKYGYKLNGAVGVTIFIY